MRQPTPQEALEFAHAVADMRARQCSYFRTRIRDDLNYSKAAERRVDRMLESLGADAAQQSLFGGPTR